MNNLTHIKGKILHKYATPSKNHLLLRIGTGGNVVLCFVTDPILKKHFEDFSIGDCVNITGNIQSSRRYNSKLQREDDTQIIFVDSVIPASYTDRSWYNRFWLYGKVVRVQELKDCLKLFVRTNNNGRLSFVPIAIYYPTEQLKNIKRGSYINVEGSVQSVKKYDAKTGQNRYYQNYVAARVW